MSISWLLEYADREALLCGCVEISEVVGLVARDWRR
jgi:hypothetical protein